MSKSKKPDPKKANKKKTPGKKAASAQGARKKKKKELPEVFKPGTEVNVWENQEEESAPAKPCIRHLSCLQLKYIATSLAHIQAEIDLFSEATRTGDIEYASQVSEHVSDRLGDFLSYLKEHKVLID